MKPRDPEIVNALDRFGRDVVVPARDLGLETFDAGIAHAPRTPTAETAPEVQAMIADYNKLAELPPAIQEAIRRIVLLKINSSIHDLLLRLSEEWMDLKCQLTLDGVDLFHGASEEMYWPGLHGGLYTKTGWYSRFSKFGEYGRPNASISEPEDP